MKNAARASPRAVAWVADDDGEMVDLVSDCLKARGFNVEIFTNGDELADALWYVFDGSSGRPPPDLVVTDVFMPGQSGLDVMAMLRCGDWHIPIIVITGAPSEEITSEAERLGAVDILEKPFDTRRLQALAALSI